MAHCGKVFRVPCAYWSKEVKDLFECVENCQDGKELEKILVDDQVNREFDDRYYYGPLLHRALIQIPPNLEVARRLLSHSKVDVNFMDRSEQTPLYAACGCPDSIEMLLEHTSVDPNILNNYGRGVLHVAKGRCLELILADPRTNVNVREFHLAGGTPLHEAYRFDLADLDRLLAHPDIKVNAVNSFGKTPLVIAFRKRKLPVFKRLLEDDRVVVSTRCSKSTDVGWGTHSCVVEDLDANRWSFTPLELQQMKGLLVYHERKRAMMLNKTVQGIEKTSRIPEDVLRKHLLPFLTDHVIFEGRFLSNKQHKEWQQYLNLV